jgi:hypothetical protein
MKTLAMLAVVCSVWLIKAAQLGISERRFG